MSERRKTILIVDDDEGMRETLRTAMLRRDYRVLRAATGEAALEVIEEEDVDLMLLDLRLPGIGGFDVLKIVRENYPYIEVMVISVVKELERRDRGDALRHVHYIPRISSPTGADAGGERERAPGPEPQHAAPEVPRLRSTTTANSSSGPAAQRTRYRACAKVAKLPATVLILGESGTGKELLARLSSRVGRSQRAVRCGELAAIPESCWRARFRPREGLFHRRRREQIGKFELADGGTLFLDEVGDLRSTSSRSSCACCRRTRSSASADRSRSRPMFAWSPPPTSTSTAVKQGGSARTCIPSEGSSRCRCRRCGGGPKTCRRWRGFSCGATARSSARTWRALRIRRWRSLQLYWWAGNVRELENLVERLVAVYDKEWIEDEDLPLD